MRLFVVLSLAALTSFAAACAPAATSMDAAAIGRAIDSLDTSAQRWLATGLTDSIVTSYYTSDAIVMNPNSPADRGSGAIHADLTNMFKTNVVQLNSKRTAMIASDSVASDNGTYTLTIRDKSDTSKILASDHGNYVTTYVKRNGQWRALYDIATSEVPPAAPVPPPTSKKK